MDISLNFAPSISETYRQRLRAFAENILAQGLTENKPPYISYPGMNEDTRKALCDLRRDYYEQHQG